MTLAILESRRPAAAAPAWSAQTSLITVFTRGRCPLMVLDPRAGEAVDRHIRRLHGRSARVLAWTVLPDHVHLLTVRLRPDVDPTARLVTGTEAALRRLGHPRPWQLHPVCLPLRPRHDLAALLAFVLASPARAGLVEDWSEWRWGGSGQWPRISPRFLAHHPSGLLWLDALTDMRAA